MFHIKSPGNILYTGLLASGILCLGGLASQAALADVTAVFEASGNEMTIEYRDDDHIRMRTADNAFLVIREGKGYMVSREDGEWFVVAIDDMINMMGAAGVRPETPGSSDDIDFDLRDTGRTETIAGIQGKVYEYAERDSWTGDAGPVTEVVISDDPNIRAVYRGFMRATGMFGATADQRSGGVRPDDVPSLEDNGLLRYGNEWRLVSLNHDPIPDRHFSLPAEPRPMPGFGGPTGHPGMDHDTSDVARPDDGESGQPGWAEKEARELGETAANEAREETRRVSDEVREGVREGIRGLFGR